MAYSAEKRSTDLSDADDFLLSSRKKFKQEKPSTEIPISDPENKSGVSKVLGTDGSSSKGHETEGSSGKRKHSRWDTTPQADEQNVDDAGGVAKRRKTRWADDDSQLKMLGPIHLPGFKDSAHAANDPEFQKLYQRLLDINCKLTYVNSIDKIEDPSCPKLIKEKQEIIRQLIHKNPTFHTPSDVKQQKLSKKLYIPVKEYPEYNFIGLILGPRGRTKDKLEMETGARIKLRGKGSSKDGKTKRRDGKADPSDEEDLHVYIEAKSQRSLDAAVAMVEKLLVPIEDGKNELKLSQLRELAKLNNTLRGENTFKTGQMSSKTDGTCEICNDSQHRTVACPLTVRRPGAKVDEHYFLCETCGDAGHLSVACPLSGTSLQTKANNMNILLALGDGSSLSTTKPFLGNQTLDFRPSVNSVPFGSNNSNRGVDNTNLYVAHLAQNVDVSRLVQLFSPFGALSSVKVIRDEGTGLSKGYGFVKYMDPTSATVAVNQMNGYRLDGMMLAVRVADHQHGTLGSMLPVEHTGISFPPAYPKSSATTHIPAPTCWPVPPSATTHIPAPTCWPVPPSATTHIPASTCWPVPPGSILPQAYDQMCTSYGSSYAGQIPSSLAPTLNATSDELARFPGNPDNFTSGHHSLFS